MWDKWEPCQIECESWYLKVLLFRASNKWKRQIWYQIYVHNLVQELGPSRLRVVDSDQRQNWYRSSRKNLVRTFAALLELARPLAQAQYHHQHLCTLHSSGVPMGAGHGVSTTSTTSNHHSGIPWYRYSESSVLNTLFCFLEPSYLF